MSRSDTIMQRGSLHGLWGVPLRMLTFPALMFWTVQSLEADEVRSMSELKKLGFEELMAIEVTSVSRRPERLREAASAIQVITGEEIRRSGATGIAEALRLASNLQVAQKSARSWGISARGFNTELANKLLVLVDGRTVYTPLYSGVFWDRQDYLMADIDRIEVISGPGGSLWGANAVNGVINIATMSAKDTQGFFGETGGGSELSEFVGARFGGVLTPGVYYRVYGKHSARDSTVLTNGSDGRDSWRMNQGGFRIDAETSAENTLTLQGDVFRNDETGKEADISKSSGGNVLGRWTRSFANESEAKLQLYYDRTNLSSPAAPLVLDGTQFAPGGTLWDKLDTFDLDFQHRFRASERHHLVWGLGYRFTHNEVGNTPSLAFLPPMQKQNLYGGFLQDEISLGEPMLFTLGTKIEHNDYTGLEVEPSVRLQWQVTEDQMLWTAASRAVRTPSRIDRDLSQATPPYLVLLTGGAGFDSEKVTAYELGYRSQLGSSWFVSLATFYNVYDDVRSTSSTPVTVLPFYFENNLAGETHGLELSVDWQASGWWRLHFGYNLLNENIRVKPGRADLNNALNETADPRNQLSLRSAMDLPGNWELDAGLRWVDSFVINNNTQAATVPSYAELDVRLGWRPTPSIELSLVGQNLLHDHHLEYGAPGPGRNEIERGVYGKITWRY